MAGVELATAYVSLVPTTKGIQREVTKELGGVPKTFDAAGKKSGGSFTKATKAALLVGGGIAAGIGLMFKTGVDEEKDFLAGQAQLAASVKSTGGTAGVSVGQMEDLASSIQNFSGQTDDSVVSAENLLLGFKNIKNTGTDKIFDQTTLAAANMAAKLGGDAASKAKLLGKALNDPVKGTKALAKVGVTFSLGQKAAIDALVKTGDTAGAQKVILAELDKTFGGAAKAAGDTLPGQLTKAKRGFEDASQSLVAALLPALQVGVDILSKYLVPALQATIGFFTGGSVKAKVLGGVIALLAAGLGIAAATLAVMNIVTGIQAVLAGEAAAETVIQAVALGVQKAALFTSTAAMWLFNAALSANPIALVVIGLVALVAGLVVAYKKSAVFRAIVTGAFDAIRAVVLTALRLVKSYLSVYIGAFLAIWRTGWTVIKTVVAGAKVVIGAVLTALGAPIRAIGSAFSAAYTKVKDFVGRIVSAVTGIPSKIASVAGDLASTGKDLITGFWHGITSVASQAGNLAAGLATAVKNGLNDVLNLPYVIPKIRIGAFGHYATLGGETLIPALARGGLTAGPTMAMIGDNRSGRELVMPMDSPATVGLLAKAIAKAGSSSGPANSFHITQLPNQSGSELAEIVASRVAFAARSR